MTRKEAGLRKAADHNDMSDDPSSMTGGAAKPVAATIDILISSDAWREAGLAARLIRAARAALDAGRWRHANFSAAELAIELADDDRVAALNQDYRGKEGPTNVLSFPALPPSGLEQAAGEDDGRPLPLGDIILAYGVTRREAAAQAKTLGDHAVHLIVHGVLHCLGYDHESEAEAEAMEAEERRILAGLGVADPYLAQAGADA